MTDPITQALTTERNKNRERLTNALEELGLFIQVEDTKDTKVFRYGNVFFDKYNVYGLHVSYNVNSGKRKFYIVKRNISSAQQFKHAVENASGFEPTYVNVFGNVKDKKYHYTRGY